MVLRGTIKVVYEKVSAILQERGYEFSSKRCLRNCCFLLKNSFLLFSALFFAIYFLFSRQFVFVMQPNDAKAKTQHYFKVARGIAML